MGSTPDPQGRSATVLSPLGESFDTVVEGMSDLELWGLWLLLPSLPIDGTELGRYLESFGPAFVEVWHINDGGGRSDAIRRKLRALGQYPGLTDEVVSRLTIDVDGQTYYSDVGRVSAYGALGTFLGRSTASADSILGVQPHLPGVSRRDWSLITLPLAALWIDRKQVLSAAAGAETLLRGFVQAAIALGMVPVVLGFDIAMRPSLVAIGSRDKLANAARRLGAEDRSPDLDERLRRGIQILGIP